MRRLAQSLLVLALLSVGTARAAPLTVAVMPWKDLTVGGRSQVGEAVRETVTADLRQVSGIKLLERDRIDHVLKELDLAAKKAELEGVPAVRAGTVLGATHLVGGAYQRAGATVRLTARMTRVETGEIIGTAKVDGPATDFLVLQDKLTRQLVASLGVPLPVALASRRPPKLKRPDTVELYGAAVTASEPAARAKALRDLLAADPDFVYAARDLAELEGRMAEYGRVSTVKMAEEERRALASLRGQPPGERLRRARELFDAAERARRWHALEALASSLAAPPAALDEEALWRLFVARDKLRKTDLALQHGETYLKTFPTGPHFRDVEGRMRAIAEARTRMAARKAEYEQDLAEQLHDHPSGPLRDFAPCIAAIWTSQHDDKMLIPCREFAAKHARNPDPDIQDHVIAARFYTIVALAARGDFAAARPLADRLRADSHKFDPELLALMADWPTD